MKKKWMLILLALLFLVACNKDQGSLEKMTLQKAVLTEKEQSLVDLLKFHESNMIVDYQTDEKIKSLKITVYELVDQKWKSVGVVNSNQSVPKGRIALSFDNIAQSATISISDQGVYKLKQDATDLKDVSRVTSYLDEKMPIVYGEEIPLVVQILSSKSEISSPSTVTSFSDPSGLSQQGHDKVFAVTCLFTEQ